MEHTAYRQIRSVFGIASIPNTGFGSITPNTCSNCCHWVESVWKQNTLVFSYKCKFPQVSTVDEIPKT